LGPIRPSVGCSPFKNAFCGSRPQALDNDEARMTNAEGMTKSECQRECNSSWLAGSDFASSDFFRHSTFVIRISVSVARLRIFVLHLSGVFLRCALQLKPWHRVFVLEFLLGQARSPAFGFFAAR